MKVASHVRTLLSLILLPPLALTGCGGGMSSQHPAAADAMAEARKAAKPIKLRKVPPPSILAASYSLTILHPLPGAGAAQAEAINDAGTVVGWSVLNGTAEATEWISGTGKPMDLGPGFALAVNGRGQWAGYRGYPPQAIVGSTVIPLLAGYDSAQATGIDEDGTVVGTDFDSQYPSVQTGFRWTRAGGTVAIPELAAALAIHKGVVGGEGIGGDAMAGGRDLGIQGAVTAVGDAGAGGFTFGSVTQGIVWHAGTLTMLGTGAGGMSLASGISVGGIVVGQMGSSVTGSVRLAPRGSRPESRVVAHFVGSTKGMGWTVKEGMVDLNSRMTEPGESVVFATGINTIGAIVGAAVNAGTMETDGFVMVPKP